MLARKVQRFSGEIPITNTDHPNLVAMYTMDNVSGSTLVDETSNSRDMTLIGGPSFITGKIGNAISTSGTQYGSVSSSGFLTSAGAVSFWGTANTFMRYCGVFQPGVNNYYQFLSDGAGVFFVAVLHSGISYSQVNFNISGTLSDFHHFVVMADSSSLSVYIDGVDVTSSGSVASGSLANFHGWFAETTATVFEIGRSAGSSIFYSPTVEDQLRIFNRTLTSAEVSDLYNGGSGA